MAKIYLPTQYLNKPCYQVNNGYIQVYNTINTNQTNVVYRIYINQDYQVQQTTGSYSTTTICDSINTYTDNFYYRVDMPFILLMFTIFCIFCFLIPLRIFTRLFKKGGL